MSCKDDIQESKDDLMKLSKLVVKKNNKKNIHDDGGCNPEEKEWPPPGFEVGDQSPPTPTRVVGLRLTKPGIENGDARTSPRTTRAANIRVKQRLSQGEDTKTIDSDTKIFVSVRGEVMNKDTMRKR